MQKTVSSILLSLVLCLGAYVSRAKAAEVPDQCRAQSKVVMCSSIRGIGL